MKVDGIIGPLTIGAIRRFQSTNLGFNDGRVDPVGQTLARLSALVPQPSPSSSRQKFGVITGPPASAKPTPLAAAITATPTAQLWARTAVTHLTGLQQGLIASGGVIFFPLVFNIVNTHFHLDQDPTSILVNLGRAIRVFNRILTMLSDPGTFYREGPAITAPPDKVSLFADARLGGFFLPENAASYAAFAIHAFFFQDLPFGLDKKSQ